MRAIWLAAILPLLMCGEATSPTPEFAGAAQGQADTAGDYIVVLKAGNPSDVARDHGVAPAFVYSHALNGFAARLPAHAVAALRRNPNVLRVEADGDAHAFGTESPTPSWGIDRVDQRTLPLSHSYTWVSTGAGVTIYGLDTGIRSTHADFAGRLRPGATFVHGKKTTEDCHGHGTHTAGTFGGTAYGVAKGVWIVPVRVLDCYGNGRWSAIIAGIDWVTANAHLPAVANMSLGGSFNQSLNDAVTGSIASGIVYVVAAGNSSTDVSLISPASTPTALTIAATDSLDQSTVWTDFGPLVDLYAPGAVIKSDWFANDTATRVGSGTSMSSPHVAGAAALYLQAHPMATPAQVASALTSLATTGVIKKLPANTVNRLLYTTGL